MSWLDDLSAHAMGQVDDRVREALSGRGVTDEQIDAYQIGHLDQELPDLGYSKKFIEWSREGRKLDDCLVLPLTNVLGEIRGLQFRHVEQERAGYMDFIERNGEAILFGLSQAMPHIWRSQEVFLVEGAFDVFPVQRVYPATVATLTNRVVAPLVRLLRRLTERVWMGYDMDGPGREACQRFEKEHGSEFGVGIVQYPQIPMGNGKRTKDPSDLWEVWGDEQFASFLRSVVDRTAHGAF